METSSILRTSKAGGLGTPGIVPRERILASDLGGGTVVPVRYGLLERRRLRRVRRLVRYVGVRAAYTDPAWQNYFTKLELSAQDNLYRVRACIAETYSTGVADYLFLRQARCILGPRDAVRILTVCSISALWLNGAGSSTVLPVAGGLLGAHLLTRAFITKHAEGLFFSFKYHIDDPLAAFSSTHLRRALRRSRRSLPARALRPHRRRDEVLAALGLDADVLSDLVLVLADEYEGTAYELLDAAVELDR
jgi:hypothetical protein